MFCDVLCVSGFRLQRCVVGEASFQMCRGCWILPLPGRRQFQSLEMRAGITELQCKLIQITIQRNHWRIAWGFSSRLVEMTALNKGQQHQKFVIFGQNGSLATGALSIVESMLSRWCRCHEKMSCAWGHLFAISPAMLYAHEPWPQMSTWKQTVLIAPEKYLKEKAV